MCIYIYIYIYIYTHICVHMYIYIYIYNDNINVFNKILKLLNSFKSAQYQITVEHYSFYCYYLNLSRNSEFHVFTIFRQRVACLINCS